MATSASAHTLISFMFASACLNNAVRHMRVSSSLSPAYKRINGTDQRCEQTNVQETRHALVAFLHLLFRSLAIVLSIDNAAGASGATSVDSHDICEPVCS